MRLQRLNYPVQKNDIEFVFSPNSKQYSWMKFLSDSVKHSVLAPYKVAMAFFTLLNFKKNPTKSLSQQVPRIQRKIEKKAYHLGLLRSYPYVSELYFPALPIAKTTLQFKGLKIPFLTLRMPYLTTYICKDTKLIDKVLEQQRNTHLGGLRSLNLLFGILQEIFPDILFDRNDTVFTCDKLRTTFYHKVLIQALKKDPADVICKNINKILVDWEAVDDPQEISNVPAHTREYTSRVIWELISESILRDFRLNEAVHFMNQYLFKSILGGITELDQSKFAKAKTVFKEFVDALILKDQVKPLPFLQNSGSPLSESQKIAMIFFLFFAGQETTSFALDKVLFDLAKNTKVQEELHLKFTQLESDYGKQLTYQELRDIPELTKFIDTSLLELPPVPGVARLTEEYTLLKFTTKKDPSPIHKYIPPKSAIIANTTLAAKEVLRNNSPERQPLDFSQAHLFGTGPHVCLGKDLALREIFLFTYYIVQKYKISTPNKQFESQCMITRQAQNYSLKLDKRKQNFESRSV